MNHPGHRSLLVFHAPVARWGTGAAFEQIVAPPSIPRIQAGSPTCSNAWKDRVIEPGCSYLVTAPMGATVLQDMMRDGEWENASMSRGNVSDEPEARAKFLDSEMTEGWRQRLTGTFRGPRTRLPPSVAVYLLPVV